MSDVSENHKVYSFLGIKIKVKDKKLQKTKPIDKRIPISYIIPYVQNLELTNHCVMKCKSCPRTTLMTREKGFMDFDLYKKIIDEIASFHLNYDRVILFLHHFGESLLHPKVDEAIAYSKSKNIKTGLSLNPMMLTEQKAIKILKAKPDMLLFMIDGDSNETFEEIRGVKNAYDITVKNTLRALELQKELSPKTIIEPFIVDNPKYKDIVDNACKMWKEKYNVELKRKEFCAWNGASENINEMQEYTNCETVCMEPWRSVNITWNGLVLPCHADFDNLYVIGDIKEKTILEIWNDEPMQNLRRELLSGNIKNNLCRNCRYTKHCN